MQSITKSQQRKAEEKNIKEKKAQIQSTMHEANRKQQTIKLITDLIPKLLREKISKCESAYKRVRLRKQKKKKKQKRNSNL